MTVHKVKDVVSLYPRLREIAGLCRDDGDKNPEGLPAYQISPCDLNTYFNSDNIPAISIDGRTLTAFEVVELYRQLVYQDRKDGTSKLEDGKISEKRFSKEIFIPAMPKGYHYWGNSWNPVNRLNTFLEAYPKLFDELCGSADKSFPRARAYVGGNKDGVRTHERKLYKEELAFLDRIIGDLQSSGKGKYADLVRSNLKNMKGLTVNIDPKSTSPGEMEAKAFGFTYLFSTLDNTPMYFISYPQFGQRNFFDRRECKVLHKVKKPEGHLNEWPEQKEQCMPLNGYNARKYVLQNILQPFFKQSKPQDDKVKRLAWSRLGYYLQKLRVYAFLRYELTGTNRQLREFFGKALVLHEAIHYRNTTPPPTDETVFGKISNFLSNIFDSYTHNYKLGSKLVEVQSCALEAKLALMAEYNDRKCRLQMEERAAKKDGVCAELNRKISFLQQVSELAEDAEEWIVDNEVYNTLIGSSNLKEIDWGRDRDLALNDNEIALLGWEHHKQITTDKGDL